MDVKEEQAVLATPQKQVASKFNGSPSQVVPKYMMSPGWIDHTMAESNLVQETAVDPSSLSEDTDLIIFTVPEGIPLTHLEGMRVTIPDEKMSVGSCGSKLQLHTIQTEQTSKLHVMGCSNGKANVRQISAMYSVQNSLPEVQPEEEPVEQTAMNALNDMQAAMRDDGDLPSEHEAKNISPKEKKKKKKKERKKSLDQHASPVQPEILQENAVKVEEVDLKIGEVALKKKKRKRDKEGVVLPEAAKEPVSGIKSESPKEKVKRLSKKKSSDSPVAHKKRKKQK